MADLLPIYQPPSTAPKPRPSLVWYTQELVVIYLVDQDWQRRDVSSTLHPNSSEHR